MTANDALFRWFGRRTALQQTFMIAAACIIAADIMTLLFYSIFFYDRLLLDLILTTVITVAISFPLGYVFFSQNVRLQRLAAQLDKALSIDDLTGLRNRNTFFKESYERIRQGAGSACAGSLLFIDADHFKSVNDTYGHAAGDAVLRELGSVILSCTRNSDVVARLGGEEFAVFLAGSDTLEAHRVAEQIREKTRAVGHLAGIPDRTVTVSIGVSVHRSGQCLDDLLLEADRCLYSAKGLGRDCVVHHIESPVAPCAAA